MKYIFLKFGVRIYDYIVEVIDSKTNEVITTLGGVDTNNDGNFESGKKGVAEPFVMLVRGWGEDERTYWEKFKIFLEQTGQFRQNFEDNTSNPKPMTIWDTAITYTNAERDRIIYPEMANVPEDKIEDYVRIGQLKAETAGEKVFQELELWIEELQQSTKRYADSGKTIEIESPNYVPEHFYVLSHSLGAPTSRKLEQIIKTKLKDKGYTKPLPRVKKNIMLAAANQGGALTWEFNTMGRTKLFLAEMISKKKKKWSATQYLMPNKMAEFNHNTPFSPEINYHFISGHNFWGGGVSKIKATLINPLCGYFRYRYSYYKQLELEADHSGEEMKNDSGITVYTSRGEITDKVWNKLVTQYGFKESTKAEYEFYRHAPNKTVHPSVPLNHHYGMVETDYVQQTVWPLLEIPPKLTLNPTLPPMSAMVQKLNALLENDRPIETEVRNITEITLIKIPFSLASAQERKTIETRYEGGGLSVKLTDPDGITYDPKLNNLPENIEYMEEEGLKLCSIKNAKAGAWEISYEPDTTNTGTLHTETTFWSNLNIKIETSLLNKIPLGQDVPIQAKLIDADSLISNAVVTAKIFNSQDQLINTVTLMDDGGHNDEGASDKIFGNMISNTDILDSYYVEITAHVNLNNGNNFILNDSLAYDTFEKQNIQIENVLAERAIMVGDKISGLEFDVQVSFSGHNPFTLTASLYDQAGNFICVGSGPVRGDPGSTVVSTIFFSADQIYEKGFNGPYKVGNFSITKDDDPYNYAFNHSLEWQTEEYQTNQFEFEDQDKDGLSDLHEMNTLKTDETIPDTDNDGMTDFQEVNRDGDPTSYTAGNDTDPLNPDTDGDEHLDGQDAFPLDPSEWSDRDADGHGDNSDYYPDDPTQWEHINNPPVAVISGELVYEATSAQGAQISISGASSTDPDTNDQIENYVWSYNSQIANGVTLNSTLPLGEHSITLTVNDGEQDSTPVNATVKVQDTTAPVLQIPAAITVNSTGVKTPVNIGTATATDYFPVTITNNAPAEGFAIGVTQVTWEATDSSNNKATGTQQITVVDPNVTSVTARLINSQGMGIQNGSVAYYDGSTWVEAGYTDSAGQLILNLSSSKTLVTLRMSYEGNYATISQDIHTQSVYTFQTFNTSVVFQNSSGLGVTGGIVKYNIQSTWYDMGTTDATGRVSKELLPGNYSFKMMHEGGSYTISKNVNANTEVLFKLIKMTVSLKDSQGNKIAGGVVTRYKNSTWVTLGTTSVEGDITQEVLPDWSCTFMMTYGGASTYKSVYGSQNTEVVFQTVKATVVFQNSAGADHAGGVVKYNIQNTWYDMGTTDATGRVSKELLPGNSYEFKMLYDDGNYKITKNITANTEVLFKLIKITVSLKDSQGNKVAGGVVTRYKNSTWITLGTTSVEGEITQEVLPDWSCTFMMTYAGASTYKSVYGTQDTEVVFQA